MAKEQFHEIPLYLDKNNTYPAHATSLIERKDGTILIAPSGQGIYKIIKVNKELITKKLSQSAPSN